MNAQDSMYAKMAHLSSKKQEGLRERIDKVIGESEGLYNEVLDSILQQVIEWVDKEIIGEDEKGQIKGLGKELSNNVQGIKNTLRASQRQKLSQLKEGKV